MNLLTRSDNENEMATRNTAVRVGDGSLEPSTKPANHSVTSHNHLPAQLEPDGERIQPGHTLNALHDDVFSPPRRLDTSPSSAVDADDNRGKANPHGVLESPKKKKKFAHKHLHLPHLHLHVPHPNLGTKHHDAQGGGQSSDPLGTAEHHRDTSSTARIEQNLSTESSASAKMELFGSGATIDEDRQDAKLLSSSDPDRDVSELSTSQVSTQSGTRPPPPSAEPSSTSLRSSQEQSSVSTNSTGVRPSHPHDHGIHSLLHSPILAKSTKAIGKLAHGPHLPHIPELPHIHLHASRGPSVEGSLAALDLEDTSITSIMEHMGKHPENVRVQERGCARLTKLAKEKDNMQEITEAGGIEIIIDAVKRCPDDTELIAQAFSALGNLAALDSANKQKIAHLNGIETIISAMFSHSYDPVVQERSCGLLFNLSFDHTNKELIAEHHGLEAIIDAMKHFPAYPNLQHNACCALWNLGGSVANKERIANSNGVHTIIKSMDHHHSHPHVQRSALGALRTLSMHHGAKEHIAEHGGIASTLNAMRHHQTDRHVQKEACGLMRNMLTHHHHRETLRSHRPERELEHAADNFPLDCEDNAWSCIERLEAISERNASSRTHSRHATATDADVDVVNGASSRAA